ncbi:hypothetical protein BDZ85DRAFT_188379 [Elsinoe ampelina]|uniref:Uncharacterized protein n=1 Tax=Elsinoe ampelina TaxID=302913 RepID=A0A6A6GR04_9PEZI|nr:hypothetical protein BDZ85DRAFT_188379 [Elsinoe ampelina]
MICHKFTTNHITIVYGHSADIGFFLHATDERINSACDDAQEYRNFCYSIFDEGDGTYLNVHTGKDDEGKRVSLAVMKEVWKTYGVNPVAMRLLDWEDAEPRE